MSYLRTDGKEIEYPFKPARLKYENPNVSFPREMPDKLLAEYGVFPVVAVDPPQIGPGQALREETPELIDGKWMRKWAVDEVPIPVPEEVDAAQIRLLLLNEGLLDDVEAMIQKQSQAVRIEWEYRTRYRRDNPLLTGLAASLGLTDEQIDAFFIAAAQL
jgi:hypothetical protein